MNIPFLGQIPIVMSIREGGDCGVPVACNENTASGNAFKELAINVIRELEYRNENLKPTERVRVKKA
jgi:ATP-binding protein involved in chromosome partitioning